MISFSILHTSTKSFGPSAFCLLLLAVITSISAQAQPGLGAKYGSRDPKTCASKKEPAKGAPSVDQATKLLACNMEGEMSGNTLFLYDSIKVEVGGGTPFLKIPEIHRPGGADINGIVYDIRGSFRQYMCSPISTAYPNAGKNCRIYEVPKATGRCFKDNFGEWLCKLTGDHDYGTADQAPPK